MDINIHPIATGWQSTVCSVSPLWAHVPHLTLLQVLRPRFEALRAGSARGSTANWRCGGMWRTFSGSLAGGWATAQRDQRMTRNVEHQWSIHPSSEGKTTNNTIHSMFPRAYWRLYEQWLRYKKIQPAINLIHPMSISRWTLQKSDFRLQPNSPRRT